MPAPAPLRQWLTEAILLSLFGALAERRRSLAGNALVALCLGRARAPSDAPLGWRFAGLTCWFL